MEEDAFVKSVIRANLVFEIYVCFKLGIVDLEFDETTSVLDLEGTNKVNDEVFESHEVVYIELLVYSCGFKEIALAVNGIVLNLRRCQ